VGVGVIVDGSNVGVDGDGDRDGDDRPGL